jgi:acyl carrier protein phosphodiesterase
VNFLAHAHLSPKTSSGLLCGNTLGDFYRNKDMPGLSNEVITGIYLHRAIDSYTDTHPIVRQARSVLFAEFRHYSRVLVDIYYDHFLARAFSAYSNENLQLFSHNVYQTLLNHPEYLNQPAKYVAQAMSKGDWFDKYQTLEGISITCQNMARRIGGQATILARGGEALQRHYAALEITFTQFYPQLQAYTQDFLEPKKRPN